MAFQQILHMYYNRRDELFPRWAAGPPVLLSLGGPPLAVGISQGRAGFMRQLAGWPTAHLCFRGTRCNLTTATRTGRPPSHA